MATRIARADGNWLDASTWGVGATGTNATLIGSNVTNFTGVNQTTYYQSSSFTITNGEVLDGILLIGYRNGTTGTITVGLSEDGGSTWVREVTLNLSDLPSQSPGAWVFFKFSTYTADGGSDYRLGIKTSSGSSGVNFRNDNATHGNWTRVFRTTATAAPAAGDNLYVAKEWTAAGTGTARTVTMDALASSITDHGTLDIGQGGTLTYGSTAATDYYLRLSGDLNVWDGGALNIGTTGTPIPTGSTANLNFDCGSNVQFGLLVQNGGTFIAQGASKTVKAFLAADAGATDTSLTTDVSTGWKSGDEIAIASTTRTASQCESKSLTADAVTTTLTIAALTNAHSGTAPTRAELANLTRNVQVFGASATLQTYVLVNTTATVDWDYAEFYWLGSGTGNKRGIDIQTTTGNFNAQYCSVHDFMVGGSIGMFISGAMSSNITISNCVGYDLEARGFTVDATSGAWTFTDNMLMISRSDHLVILGDIGGTFSGTFVGSAGIGVMLQEAATAATFGTIVTHSNASRGFVVTLNPQRLQVGSLSAWRNNSDGVYSQARASTFIFNTFSAFGNNASNIYIDRPIHALHITDGVFSGDTTFSTAIGINLANEAACIPDLRLNNCTFGVASGIRNSHTSADVSFAANSSVIGRLNKCLFQSVPTISTAYGTILHYQGYQQTAGDHRTHFAGIGTIQTDTTHYRTASPSERLTPSSASIKLESGPKRKVVNNGSTITFSVQVRKSVLADGAAYNGNQPRLVLRKNVAAGISADTVLDTATAASDGAWEELTGTSAAVTDDAVLEAFVDCDGTGGWINTDDWS